MKFVAILAFVLSLIVVAFGAGISRAKRQYGYGIHGNMNMGAGYGHGGYGHGGYGHGGYGPGYGRGGYGSGYGPGYHSGQMAANAIRGALGAPYGK
uniref:Glycine-rich cell wall structural protein n=1 Tax=Syphacia muris TaxID=451379 RepID=A0A0N5AZU0_9BILA